MILMETARLLLRNVAVKDAEIMYDYRNNEMVGEIVVMPDDGAD